MSADEHLSPGQTGTYTFTRWEKERGTAWTAHVGQHRVGYMSVTYFPERHEHFATEGPEHWDQSRLFTTTQQPRPAQDKVGLLQSTRHDRVAATTMLGMAQNVAFQRTGRGLTTPEDLSPHSSRLVKHGKRVGAVDRAAPTETWNDMDFMPQPEFNPPSRRVMGGAEIVRNVDVAAGRRTVRNTLRAGRKRRPQGEQQRLFE